MNRGDQGSVVSDPGNQCRRWRSRPVEATARSVERFTWHLGPPVLLPLFGLLLIAFVAGCRSADPIEQAQGLVKRGDRQAALELLQKAVEAHPEDTRLEKFYGATLLHSGRASRAVWPLWRASRDPALEEDAGLLLGRALLESSDDIEAERVANSLLQDNPDDMDARLLRAEARLAAHREEEAIEDLDTLLETSLDDLALMRLKLRALLQLQATDQAAALITHMRQITADDPEAPADLAARLCGMDAVFTDESGDHEAAIRLFDECLEQHPDSEVVVSKAIDFFDERKQRDRSEAILRRAIEAAPDKLGFRIDLAARLRATQRADEAGALLEEAFARLGTPAAAAALASHRVALEDLAGARDALQAGYRREGDPPELSDDVLFSRMSEEHLFALGDTLAPLHEFERVKTIARRLEEPAYRQFLLARVHFEAGEYHEALEAYAEGFRYWPANAGARFLAGQAAERIGDFDQASTHYRESLRADAAATEAGIALARIQMAEGRPGAAYNSLSYYVTKHPTDAAALRRLAELAALTDRRAEVERLRGRLAALPGQRGVAFADHARDLARSKGADAALAFLAKRLPDLADAGVREALRAWVDILVSVDRQGEAAAFLEKSVAASPEDASIQSLLAHVLLQTGRRDMARAALERALDLDPHDAAALVDRARLAVEEGEIALAVSLYDRAADSLAPDDTEPRYEAARLLAQSPTSTSGARRARLEEARTRIEALLFDHPTFGSPAALLAAMALERGDTSDVALAWARRGARFDRTTSSVATLGTMLVERGQNEEAVRVLRWAIDHGADDARSQYQLGLALRARGDRAAARQAFERALGSGDREVADRAKRELARLSGSPPALPPPAAGAVSAPTAEPGRTER